MGHGTGISALPKLGEGAILGVAVPMPITLNSRRSPKFSASQAPQGARMSGLRLLPREAAQREAE